MTLINAHIKFENASKILFSSFIKEAQAEVLSDERGPGVQGSVTGVG